MRILKIFIAGPRVIKELDKNISAKLGNICDKNYDVLVGDADGIDSRIQKFYPFKTMKDLNNFFNTKEKDSNLKNYYLKEILINLCKHVYFK